MFRRIRNLCLVSLILMMMGCGDDVESPDAQIRQLIAAGVEAAEARSAGDLETHLHPNFLDQKGYDRSEVVKLMRGLFLRHKSVYLFTKIGQIDLQTDTEATVEMHVAMAAQSISDVTALAGLRARLYAFELHLVKDENWRVIHARWRPANLSELE
jgi:hypothetical protein